MNRIFKMLLRLFPADFRDDFGREMEQVFRSQKSDGTVSGFRTFIAMMRSVPGEHWEAFRQDSRITLRSMRKNPGFAVVAVLTIALGIAAMASVFSIVDTVLLKPLPYPHADQLVRIRPVWRDFGPGSASIPEYLDLREQARTIESISAYNTHDVNIAVGQGDPERVQFAQATEGLFAVLRVKPTLGRTFEPREHETGNERVVVLSYGIWQRRFGNDPSIIGKDLQVEGASFTVIGVMPRSFYFPEKTTELWVPTVIRPQDHQARGAHNRTIVARLKDHADIATGQSEIEAVGARMAQVNPRNYPQDGSFALQLVPLHNLVIGENRSTLLLLMSAAGFLLLIACVNVVSLLLARGSTRENELAVRTALGARTGRLKRQLITETWWLSCIGGVLGLVLAGICLANIEMFAAGNVPLIDETGIDLRVALFTLGLIVVTALVLGVAPANRLTRADLGASLRNAARVSGDLRGARVRQLLVVTEIAAATVLLIGAGLTLRSLNRLLQVNPGIVTEKVVSARISLGNKYGQPGLRRAFFGDLFEKLKAGGALSVGAVSVLPLSGGTEDWAFSVENYVPPNNNPIVTEQTRFVAGDYFRTLGIPLIAGRAFDDTDDSERPLVAIVSDSLARKYWRDESPIGKRLALFSTRAQSPWITVVGVVGDIRHLGLHSEPQPFIYYPFAQSTRGMMAIVVRSNSDTAEVASSIRSALLDLDREQPVYVIRTMADYAADSISQYRFTSLVLTAIGIVALILASVGVYGLLAFSIDQRRHEFGVRLALGAERSQILLQILRQGVVLAVLGLAVGIVGALSLGSVMRIQLYQVERTDPIAIVTVILLLLGVAIVACLRPALRAIRIDPASALRFE